MRFKKSFGQNFLRDKKYISKITDAIDIDNNVVLEIGPGSGQMTAQLLSRAKHLYCIEKDLSLLPVLEKKFPQNQVNFIHGDILKFKPEDFGRNITIFGSIPFNISNQLIRYLVDNRNNIKRSYLVLQKEFARRLVATSGKNYGYLSCLVQFYTELKLLFDIPKNAFYPVPQVDATLVSVDFNKEIDKAIDQKMLFKIIKKVFSERRKKIGNTLTSYCSKVELKSLMASIGLSPDLRPENLSINDYCHLQQVLAKHLNA
jgi:16S rRNA (adenine1518-N6/adenine1519-N6)-dimethyltransferase